jgi:hypothetical protein
MDRRYEMERTYEIERAQAPSASPAHDRTWTRLLARLRPDHSLTAYACRLPSGDLGRTAIKFLNEEWTAVCVPDRRAQAGAR